MMQPLSFDSLHLFYDPTLRLLCHRWRGTHNMHLFRPAVNYVLQLLEDLDIEYWVVDLNGLPNLGLDEQIWINGEVLPHVAQLPRLRQLALVLSSNVYNQLAAESILNLGQQFVRIEIQFFSDVDGAMDWLINPTEEPATPGQPLRPEARLSVSPA